METPNAVIAPKGARTVAISYRNKEILRDGIVIEQRPTMALLIGDGKTREVRLDDEDHELCFLHSKKVTLPPKKKSGKPEGKPVVIDHEDDGIRAGDIVLMVMGGSGSFYAFALSRKLEELGAGGVYWISSTLFKQLCEKYAFERSKLKSVDHEGRRTELTFDHFALPKLFEVEPQRFHRVTARERDLILLQDVTRRRQEALEARMACAQRVRQREQKRAYCGNEEYPEGGVKLAIEAGVANDTLLALAEKEESQIEAELKRLLHSLSVWKVFEPIEGVGELTAAPLICAIGDINRFPAASNLKAFLGVHTLHPEGRKFQKGEKPEAGLSLFARRRQGQLCNWHPGGRQALYQISQQFLIWRRDSPWGMILQEAHARFRAKYPHSQVWVRDANKQVVRKVDLIEGKHKRVQGGYEITHDDGTKETVHGVTKFNPAHLNRMASWRTMTKFVEWLYDAWKATEAGLPVPALPYLKQEGELGGGEQLAA